jgi:hypothetical protein
VPNGYRRIDYVLTIKGDGIAEHEDMHKAVQATSPNYFNVARPIDMCGTLRTA